jgi:hypothetical protein
VTVAPPFAVRSHRLVTALAAFLERPVSRFVTDYLERPVRRSLDPVQANGIHGLVVSDRHAAIALVGLAARRG